MNGKYPDGSGNSHDGSQIKTKRKQNHMPCTLRSLALFLSAFLPAVAPGLSISMDNSLSLNYMYVMNNNNPSSTLEIMNYYYSCNKECSMNHKIILL